MEVRYGYRTVRTATAPAVDRRGDRRRRIVVRRGVDSSIQRSPPSG
jgi:hypothetical protein